MVGLGAKASLLAIVLAATLLAGCVGDDDVDAGAADEGTDANSGGSDGTGSSKTDGGKKAASPKKSDKGGEEVDAAKAGCQFTFCIEGHVYAPVWDVGMTWTYDVTGTYYPVSDYAATFGVFKINDDHFLLGTNSELELKNSVAAQYGVMTGQVQKDSYGVLEHDAYQDLLGFLKIEDTTWKAKLWDKEFTLVKEPSMEIEHAAGKSLGIQVNGQTEDGDKLLIEYASDAAWLTKFEWKGPEGEVLLSYTLTEYDHDGAVSDMKIWETVDWLVVRGAGNASPTSAPARWIASGTASFVFIHVVTEDPISTGIARAVKPSGQMEEFVHDGPQVEDRITDFETGDWVLHTFSDRGKLSGDATQQAQMSLWIYQVNERAAA